MVHQATSTRARGTCLPLSTVPWLLGYLLASVAVLAYGLDPLTRPTWRDEKATDDPDIPRPVLQADEPTMTEVSENVRHKLPVGEAAPDVALRDLLTGRQVRLSELRGGKWTVLLLSSFT